MRYIMPLLLMLGCGEPLPTHYEVSFETPSRSGEVNEEEMHYLARSLAHELELWGGYDAGESYDATLLRDVMFVDKRFPLQFECEPGVEFCRDAVEGSVWVNGAYLHAELRVIAVLHTAPCLGYTALAHEWLHVMLRYHGERYMSDSHQPEELWQDLLYKVNKDFEEAFCGDR